MNKLLAERDIQYVGEEPTVVDWLVSTLTTLTKASEESYNICLLELGGRQNPWNVHRPVTKMLFKPKRKKRRKGRRKGRSKGRKKENMWVVPSTFLRDYNREKSYLPGAGIRVPCCPVMTYFIHADVGTSELENPGQEHTYTYLIAIVPPLTYLYNCPKSFNGWKIRR